MSVFSKAVNHSTRNPSGSGDFPLHIRVIASNIFFYWTDLPRDCWCSSVNVGNLTSENNLSGSSLVLLLSDLSNDL